jgi:hypothetical protein
MTRTALIALMATCLFASTAGAAPDKWVAACVARLTKAKGKAGKLAKAANVKSDSGVTVGGCDGGAKTCFVVKVAKYNNKDGPRPSEGWNADSTSAEKYLSERSHGDWVGRIETHNVPLADVQSLVKALRPAVDQCLTEAGAP